MDREILFRGKRISDSSWVYGGIMKSFHPNYNCSARGFLEQTPNCYCICAHNKDYFVEQDTIGQFTGLVDKKGTAIFEGDIVKDIDGRIFEIEWFEYRFIARTIQYPFSIDLKDLKECEIVGNIFGDREIAE